ncbi:KRRI-Interacting protein 1 [Linnemannia exigua]|uniref:KRRI-Interacting protein 1 n=1 Tax=Linnemannia exigua TaxID=604196 RepID=A0AAD4D4A9_9FUNG|nr:KRRI-Interacting protein 1 [Linnemannia exigua]
MDSDNEEITFKINQDYADKYASSKRGQELSAIRDKYGVMDESRLNVIADRQHKYGYTKNADYDYDSYDSEDDEEEDEFGELVTPEIDGQIMKTIGLIRNQDPKIYEATSHFFIPSEMEKARKQWKEKQAEEKKAKPMNIQDYHRQVLLEDGGLVDEAAEDRKLMAKTAKSMEDMTHVEQQEYLKREMKSAFMGGEDGDDEEGDDADSFFTQKAKTKEDEEAEEEDYKRFLMESMGSKSGGAAAFQDWREYKNAPNMNQDEAFLMDYILNRGWIDKSQKKTPHYKEIVREEDLSDLEKSEEELEAAEEFESKYNFRYEDEAGNKLTGYSRTIDDSVRNADDKRKRQRLAAKERKKEEKIRQLEELKRAKNLKKQEIFNKLKQIQEITGNKTVGFNEIDLETDFNPEDYDQKMDTMFSDNYYAGDENEKPVFDDDIDTAAYEDSDDEKSDNKPAEEEDEEEQAIQEDDEAYPPEFDDGYDESGYYDENYYGGEVGVDGEEDIMMDADYMPGGENFGKAAKKETKKERMKREKEEKKLAKLKEKGGKAARTAVQALEAAKSVLDEDKKKNFNEYLDEYYQLDYEDMVGDLPTRFKYSRVRPSTFGLSPVEILLADDKDLNEFVSLKKLAAYRKAEEQAEDIQKYSKKSRVQMFRHKLKTQIKGQELEKDWDPIRLRKKQVEKQNQADLEKRRNGGEGSSTVAGDQEEEVEKKKKKKSSKDKKRKAEDEEEGTEEASRKKKTKEEEGGEGEEKKHKKHKHKEHKEKKDKDDKKKAE